MDSNFLNKIWLQTSLLLGQSIQPAVPDNSLFQINITFKDIQENLNTSRPFRMVMAKNALNNFRLAGTSFYSVYQGKQKNQPLSGIERCGVALIGGSQLLFSVASLLTAGLYPEDDNWSGFYKKKTTSAQLQTMVALCIISCGDATFFPIFKDHNDKLALTEGLISAAICVMPFFHSARYFALNINK
jgi:hypothetical protein